MSTIEEKEGGREEEVLVMPAVVVIVVFSGKLDIAVTKPAAPLLE